jgi:hypothetical protein
MSRPTWFALAFTAVLGLAAGDRVMAQAQETSDAVQLRFATFNASLFGESEGELAKRLAGRRDEQLKQIAGIIQIVRPDVLLINEFDFDPKGKAAQDFIFNYLQRGQSGLEGIRYRYHYTAPVNTGIASPFDLNRDGTVGGPNDAWGYGAYQGQYGMLLLSRYPIDKRQLRTFRLFKWKDMPDAQLPVHESGQAWYSDTMLRWFPLSSKSHWDIPVFTAAGTIHVIAAHPTPPSFDGAEGRNSRRNHDEIRLIADYVSGDPARSGYIYDDDGHKGGLPADANFVVLGDMNADPLDGNSHQGAIDQLLEHPRINAGTAPRSDGGGESAHRVGGGNLTHRGDAAADTAVFGDPPGNLRVDYVLPSAAMTVVDSGVYWPLSTEPGAMFMDASDHRLVWIDVELAPMTREQGYDWRNRR